ncbi:hypothetical protein LTR56_025763 [Elasticomyces elasticus]|nr:hypothetical protein LTR56_025763 [Elasticomyces elasticus]KAK3617967.1 hypothetical protein LTR22_026532 [Elasticomyces elasticus]KAK4907887.1 hypothetical protein LTR49_023161 [Elasticomyces elasticus]KAK5739344.1 hypothetical protein LTS12_025315 [Elasticomyces elasticus]
MAHNLEQPDSALDDSLNHKTSEMGDIVLEHTDTVDKPCHFLKIAKELRLQIYGYLLAPSVIYVRTWEQPERVGLPAEDADGIRPFISGPEEREGRVYPSILGTCQQIYNEAQQTLHSPQELLFVICLDTHGRERGTVRGGKYYDKHNGPFSHTSIHHIRSLGLITVQLAKGTGDMEKMMAHTSYFTHHLKDVNKVQKLEVFVNMDDCPCDPEKVLEYMMLFLSLLKMWSNLGTGAVKTIEVYGSGSGYYDVKSLCEFGEGEWSFPCRDGLTLYTYDNTILVDPHPQEVSEMRVYLAHPTAEDGEDPQDLHPNILRVCREVYEEAWPTLYKTAELELEPSRANRHRPEDEKKQKTILHPATRLKHISVLHSLHVTLVTCDDTTSEDSIHHVFLANSLQHVVKINALILDVEDFWSPDDDDATAKESLRALEEMTKAWGRIASATEMDVVLQHDGEFQAEWHKSKSEGWEIVYSEPSDEYAASGRMERLFDVVLSTFLAAPDA